MTVSRRKFLCAGASVGIVAAIPFKKAFAAQPDSLKGIKLDSSRAINSSSELTRSAFQEQLNTKFRFRLNESATSELKLVDVAAVNPPFERRLDGFSVMFKGPGNKPLLQGTYTIEHSRMGHFPVFVVPTGKDKQGLYYQAIFNHLRA